MDYRKRGSIHSSVTSKSKLMERVDTFKYWGVNIHEVLTWACHMTAMITTAKQHLYGLRPLSPQIFRDFYQRDRREPVERLLYYLLRVVYTAQLLAVNCPVCRSCTAPPCLFNLSPSLYTCITYMEYLTFLLLYFWTFYFTYDICLFLTIIIC